MSTFTASQMSSEIGTVHVGLQTKSCEILSVAVTGTASSVFLLVKVPDGAHIVDYIFWAESGGADNTWDLGILKPEGSASTTFSQSALATVISDSTSVTVRAPNGTLIPVKVSISSECLQRWAWVTAVNAVAISASAKLRMTIFYTMGAP